MKIAFHSGYLGYRGTEVALIDYAWGSREILGHAPFFLLPWRNESESHPVVAAMRAVAPVRFYRGPDEREGILREEKADFFYCIKNGFNDGVFSPQVTTGVHAIFRESEFHGDIYAYVSPWLSEVMSYGHAAWVPHMVRLAEGGESLRRVLGIPAGAVVFGRHGGEDSFDLPIAQQAILEVARNHPERYFLFLNTRPFGKSRRYPNIIFLPPTANPREKKAFLDTCDAMVHGRCRGETFGLSVAEFAFLGKPVFTYPDSPEQGHLAWVPQKKFRYRSSHELAVGLATFEPQTIPSPCGELAPSKVMQTFQQVFLGR
jgi:hypothetical protein